MAENDIAPSCCEGIKEMLDSLYEVFVFVPVMTILTERRGKTSEGMDGTDFYEQEQRSRIPVPNPELPKESALVSRSKRRFSMKKLRDELDFETFLKLFFIAQGDYDLGIDENLLPIIEVLNRNRKRKKNVPNHGQLLKTSGIHRRLYFHPLEFLIPKRFWMRCEKNLRKLS